MLKRFAFLIFPFIISLPLLVVIGVYWYCLSSTCETKAEHDKNADAVEHKADITALIAAISKKNISQTSGNKPVESDAPIPICSTPCYIVKKTLDDPVGLFTLFLAYLVLLQLIWMNRQEGVLRETIESAERSERAYIFLERINVNFPTRTVTTSDHPPNPVREMNIIFALRNHGKTPGIITELFADIKFCKSFDDVGHIRGEMFGGRIVSAPDLEEFNWGRELNVSEILDAKSKGNPMLLFIGIVHYKDFRKKPHWTRFCWRYDFSKEEFRVALDPDLNDWE